MTLTGLICSQLAEIQYLLPQIKHVSILQFYLRTSQKPIIMRRFIGWQLELNRKDNQQCRHRSQSGKSGFLLLGLGC